MDGGEWGLMISDNRILVNKLWAININKTPLTDSMEVDVEMFWKKKAEEIIERHLASQKKRKK
jgi:hypothetical protein